MNLTPYKDSPYYRDFSLVEGNTINCINCGKKIKYSNAYVCPFCSPLGLLCKKCATEHAKICVGKEGIKFMSFLPPENKLKSRAGNTIKSLRKVGIEIEFILPQTKIDGFHSKQFFEKLYKLKGIGIGQDPSIKIGRAKYGIEIRTPALYGRRLEKYIKSLFTLLKDSKVGINQSCGLHIHLDANLDFFEKGNMFNVNSKKLAYVVDFYSAIENWLYNMVTKNRRTNQYCHSIKLSKEEYKKLGNVKKNLIKIASGNDPYSYYGENDMFGRSVEHSAGFNIDNVFSKRNKHFEVRYHHATLNYKEVLNWIVLHQTIIDYISQEIDKKSNKNDEKVDKLIKNIEKSIKNGHRPHKILKKIGLTTKALQFITKQIKKHTK